MPSLVFGLLGEGSDVAWSVRNDGHTAVGEMVRVTHEGPARFSVFGVPETGEARPIPEATGSDRVPAIAALVSSMTRLGLTAEEQRTFFSAWTPILFEEGVDREPAEQDVVLFFLSEEDLARLLPLTAVPVATFRRAILVRVTGVNRVGFGGGAGPIPSDAPRLSVDVRVVSGEVRNPEVFFRRFGPPLARCNTRPGASGGEVESGSFALSLESDSVTAVAVIDDAYSDSGVANCLLATLKRAPIPSGEPAALEVTIGFQSAGP